MRGAIADPGSRARAVYPNARQLPAAVLAYRAPGRSGGAGGGGGAPLVPTGGARCGSRDMINRNYFSHSIPPSGTKLFDERKRRGYSNVVAGENIGKNNF